MMILSSTPAIDPMTTTTYNLPVRRPVTKLQRCKMSPRCPSISWDGSPDSVAHFLGKSQVGLLVIWQALNVPCGLQKWQRLMGSFWFETLPTQVPKVVIWVLQSLLHGYNVTLLFWEDLLYTGSSREPLVFIHAPSHNNQVIYPMKIISWQKKKHFPFVHKAGMPGFGALPAVTQQNISCWHARS